MTSKFTEGAILLPLLKFVLPVLFALFLQSMYGAIDLLVIGQFSDSANVSAVSTGAQVMLAVTTLINAFAMGTTICIGQAIGNEDKNRTLGIVGSSIVLFGAIGLVMTFLIPMFAEQASVVMQAPPEALSGTADYIAICGFGSLPLVAYNLFSSVFRGIGDSRTPLITVAIACICNIVGDLWMVIGMEMGASGVALATVIAQTVSVVISCAMARNHPALNGFTRKYINANGSLIRCITSLGLPIALQDLLVSISFLVILGIINSLGLVASAGGGVAEKLCVFIMLVPAAFMQSMSAFVAQNYGAGKLDRARKALFYGIGVSTIFGISMFFLSYFYGKQLSAIFSADTDVLVASAEYLRAYAIDCLLTCFLFCFIGYFNGLGRTRFVMVQGIVGAFFVRIPVALWMSRQDWVTLFHIGLATPCSTAVQIMLCLSLFYVLRRSQEA